MRSVASINDSWALQLENEFRNGTYVGFNRFYRRLQLAQAKAYERIQYANFDCVHTMTEFDAQYIRDLNPEITTEAIPLGVDETLFGLAPRDTSDVMFNGKLVGGNISALRSFLEQAWPHVRKACPHVRLHVVGTLGPGSDDVVSIAEAAGNVVFHGYVADMADAYRHCGIAVLPIRKECGLVTRAVEGMAAATAVISFACTFNGFDGVCPGRDCVAVESYRDFGTAIVELTRNESQRRSIQMAGRKFADEGYRWASRQKSFERMYCGS